MNANEELKSFDLGAKWRYVGYFGSSLHPPGKRNLVAIMAQRHVLGT